MVPLYARQAPAELVAMMKDCSPALICCGDAALRDGIIQNWPEAPPQYLFKEVFAQPDEPQWRSPRLADSDRSLSSTHPALRAKPKASS